MCFGLENQKSRIKNQKCRRRRRGAVAAELAVLVVFVYVPLTIGAIYVGWLALARERVHQANHYALLGEGDQSETLSDRGEVTRQFFGEFTGETAVAEGPADDPEIPGPGEIRDLFNEYCRRDYWRRRTVIPARPPAPPRASGGFTLGGGGISYEERVDPGGGGGSEARVVITEGYNYAHREKFLAVQELRLLDDQIPERLTGHLGGYLERLTAHAFYRHSWAHDRSSVVAGDDQARGMRLQVPYAPTARRDEWHPECAVRGTKVRTARGQSPPGGDVVRQIAGPGVPPSYETDTDFMHPK